MIRILTDSTADFSMADAAALGVAVVPLTVSFGDAHYQDGIDLPLERFYDMLAAADKLPTTSQPSPELFLSHFLAAKAAGDTVICVLLSAALSGTCQSAEIAKEEAEYDNIYIVDSRSATLGLQLLVRRAVQRVAEGFSAMDIVADLETARTHLRLYAVVDTLKYLHKGGRLSGAVAITAMVLPGISGSAACWASSPCFLWTPAASWAWWTKPVACPAHMSPFLKESTGAAALMKHGPS